MKERPARKNDATVNSQMQYQNVVLGVINSMPAGLCELNSLSFFFFCGD
jgi:hypothetical protein